MSWRLQRALDERLVDHDLRCDIREFAALPPLHLLPHRFEVSLRPIDTDRDAIDERERLRVLGKHRRIQISGWSAATLRRRARIESAPGASVEHIITPTQWP